MTATRRRWALLLGLAVAGCSGLEEPETFPVGVLRIFTQAGGAAGQFVGQPEATFLRSLRPELPDSRDSSDICQLANLVSISVGDVDNLDAGDSIRFTTDQATVYLFPERDLAGNEHYVPALVSVSLTPGAVVTFQIPGAAGFPGATVTAPTAPALTQLSAIPTSVSVSDSLVVTWAPTGDDSSRFEISLQFATEGSTAVNRQVLCQWRDDGRGVISGSLLSEWTTTSIRHIEVSRYRTARWDLDQGAVLYFLATYDTLPAP